MRLLALALAFLAALPVSAQTNNGDDRVRTVIMGITPRRGMDDKQLAAALTDVLQGVYAGDARRIVIGRDDIQRVLQLEADKQAAGCDSDKCLAEVGAALDASRIVTGNIDKLGDGFMITMSEIDAKTLEPIARAQEQVKNDENALVATVTKLGREMLGKGAVGASRGFANAGSMEIETDPRGAKIVLSGTEMGQSPTKIDNLATGTQKLRLLRDDYEPVEVDVPVYPGGTTKVNAQMRILRALAEKNLEIRQAKWRETNQWHTVGAWTKVGIGSLVAGGGALWGVGGLGQRDGQQALVGFALIGGAGAGVLSWGVIDLLNPPAPPVAEWEIERKVTVTPPKDQGAAQVHVIQEKR